MTASPTSRTRPTADPSSYWPTFYPPSLKNLPAPRPHPHPSSLPASIRYLNEPPPPFGASTRYRTLQDEVDDLDQEEDDAYQRSVDVRQYGYSWLVPLGRQNTHEEDEGSNYSSPRSIHLPSLSQDPNLSVDVAANSGAQGGERVRDLDAEIEDADASSDDDEDGEDGSGSEAPSRGLQSATGTEERGRVTGMEV
ncbi:hypothetical protein JCM21900_004543 [Sporobolomyces salmonicolor]